MMKLEKIGPGWYCAGRTQITREPEGWRVWLPALKPFVFHTLTDAARSIGVRR